MLRRTFLHLPGIGEVKERRLWDEGFRSWDDVLGGTAHPELQGGVAHSAERFAASDWRYFDREIPAAHKWRALADFPGRVLYVDIETDGGTSGSSLTVLGAYDGTAYHAFVADENLEAARDLLESHPLVVTFNGTLFDLPIIRDRFRYNFFNFIHIDLRFALRRLGYRGGLKAIEKQLGLARSEATTGLGGWDAVRLWRDAQRGDRAALDLLLTYNREDVTNMEPLLNHVVDGMTKQMGLMDGTG